MDIFNAVTVLCFDKGNNMPFFQPRNNDALPLRLPAITGYLDFSRGNKYRRPFKTREDDTPLKLSLSRKNILQILSSCL